VRTKVRYDLEYIRGRSLWQDIRIMLRTIPVVLFRRGGW
jgi:lipopolysaccharide/colanic/teichoic acid biosynthesis glycosyltransferase